MEDNLMKENADMRLPGTCEQNNTHRLNNSKALRTFFHNKHPASSSYTRNRELFLTTRNRELASRRNSAERV